MPLGHRLLRKTLVIFVGGTAAYYGSAAVIFGHKGLPPEAPNSLKFSAYRLLPWNVLSRGWGQLCSLHLRESLRSPIIGSYSNFFGCNLEEAEFSDFHHYSTLNEFFTRSLKPNARVVDDKADLVSPCDGRVLYLGHVEDGWMEQVKGIYYSLDGFFGPFDHTDNKPPQESASVEARLRLNNNTSLYHCVIYLAPGDYHCFHSPVEWKVDYRRYFPGYLLSVNPRIAAWLRGLFSINERVVYYGKWKHGFFSYAAIGATGVGSIDISGDKTLKTNSSGTTSDGQYYDLTFHKDDFQMGKGDFFGKFKLGSTIILIFEAPKGFEFDIGPGDRLLMGRNIGKI